MGRITPDNDEYQLLSSFIEEGLDLLGQECSIRYVNLSISDPDMNKIYYYEEEEITYLLFVEDMYDVKAKGTHWRKEKGEPIEVYISLSDTYKITSKAIVTCMPKHYNSPAKFIVTNIFIQPNTTYSRCLLVPYRESLAVSPDATKDVATKKEEGKIIKDKGYLNR